MENTDELTVVNFTSNGVSCIAAMGLGMRSFNLRVCTVSLSDKEDFSFTILLDGSARCSVSQGEEGRLWFDTDESSANQIKDLFQSTSIQ